MRELRDVNISNFEKFKTSFKLIFGCNNWKSALSDQFINIVQQKYMTTITLYARFLIL